MASDTVLGIRRQDFDIRRASDVFLTGVIPVWVRRGGAIGTSLWWEQRFWWEALGHDGRHERKREHRNGLRDTLSAQYDLAPSAISKPSDSPLAPQTLVMSTQALLAWLLHKRYRWQQHGYHAQAMRASALIARLVDIAGEACDVVEVDHLPALSCAGLTLGFLRGGRIDMSGFVAMFPDTANEWAALSHADVSLGLGPFTEEPLLVEFCCWLDARVRHSECSPTDWLGVLRSCAIAGIAFLAEVGTIQCLSADEASGHLRRPTVLLGHTKRRRQRFATLTKSEVVEQMARDGSSNVQTNVVQYSNGMASTVRRIMNDMYTSQARQLFKDEVGVALNWDQSTHGGLDVNVCICTSAHTDVGAYCRPAAPYPINMFIKPSFALCVWPPMNIFVDFWWPTRTRRNSELI